METLTRHRQLLSPPTGSRSTAHEYRSYWCRLRNGDGVRECGSFSTTSMPRTELKRYSAMLRQRDREEVWCNCPDANSRPSAGWGSRER